MTLEDAALETLIAHEARYFEIWSHVERTPGAWYLNAIDLPEYRSANRALRLRLPPYATNAENERAGEHLIREVIGHFQAQGQPVIVDVDAIAERQGLGRILRRSGVTPVMGTTLLMRWNGDASARMFSPASDRSGLDVRRILNETGAGEARDWIELAGCDEAEADEARLWRAVAAGEARSPHCHLYLAAAEGQAVGACQFFAADGWAQIDSVITHPAFRRRGVASALVSRALRDSLRMSNAVTYLFTDQGGAGEQVYRKLGFETWGVDVLRRHIRW